MKEMKELEDRGYPVRERLLLPSSSADLIITLALDNARRKRVARKDGPVVNRACL